MKIRRRLLVMLFLAMLIWVIQYSLQHIKRSVNVYDSYIFYPLQSARIVLFGWIPFSAGDVLYVLGGLLLLITIVKWIYYIARFGLHRERLAASLIGTINAALSVYLFFIIGWGANYYKSPLPVFWELKAGKTARMDSVALVSFDEFLVNRLNTYAPHYHSLSFADVNKRSIAYYQQFTDSRVRMHGLDVKPSLFAWFLERMEVDGYYNPFTGEGQVNSSLPSFVLPFVICHEMAHQAGIAAEGDANLMAYALGTTAKDSSFNYASYLDIWLYTNNRLYRHDSATARRMEMRLNSITKAHLDTLEQLSRKYNTEMSRYTNDIYDSYLKAHNQQEGIRSYGNVVTSAWLLEMKRTNELIKIPW